MSTPTQRPLSIAILGTRGVPPNYGGFETMCGELGVRLVARGHTVTVYCRGAASEDQQPAWRGIRRVDLPALRHKYLETVSHTFLSALHAIGQSYDAVLLCNAANAFAIPLLRAARVPVAVNVDGIERKRRKWNTLGRAVYATGEAITVQFADAIVSDAAVIAGYYATNFATRSDEIAYGSELPDEADSDVLERMDLRSRSYFLYVSRLEPENNPLEVVEAYAKVESSMPLVIVGHAPYASELGAKLREIKDPRVRLPGGIYGVDYRTLQRNAYVYIQATEIGGTHPALIEAMASGGAVVANGTPENLEVGSDAVLYFQLRPEETLSMLLQYCVDEPALVESLREPARERARSRYSWDEVTDRYEALFRRIANL